MNKQELRDQLIKDVQQVMGTEYKEVYFEKALPHQSGSRVKFVTKDRPSEELIEALVDVEHVRYPMYMMTSDVPGILLMTDVEMHE